MSGVATFGDLSVDRAGPNYTLVAGASGLFPDTSVGFNVTRGRSGAARLHRLALGQRGSGASFTARVAVQDAGGNLVTSASPQVTLSLANAAGATLGGTTTVTAVNGVATFTGLSVDKAGTGYTLQAAAAGLTPATSPAFGVDAGRRPRRWSSAPSRATPPLARPSPRRCRWR